MPCANCGAPSDYLLNDPGVNPVEVCVLHMPKHLTDRIAAGHFPIIR